ncbi:MAG TPA: BrnT family toxin [Rhizomicrobium sp.]|jgi:hypothetical protein
MLDPAAVLGFEWDDGNARKSAEKHGVSQIESEQLFFNEPLIARDEKHSSAEQRFLGLGWTDAGRLLHVTWTAKRGGTLIRVISARPMSRKKRAWYAQS